jgi:hypothetical protein
MGFDRWLKSTMTFEDDRSFSKSFVDVGKIMEIQRIDGIFRHFVWGKYQFSSILVMEN